MLTQKHAVAGEGASSIRHRVQPDEGGYVIGGQRHVHRPPATAAYVDAAHSSDL